MSLFKTTMSWLGLGPDSEYEPAAERSGAVVDPGLAPQSMDSAHPTQPTARVSPTPATAPSVDPVDRGDFTAVRSLGPMSDAGGAVEPVGTIGVDDRLGEPLSNRSLEPLDVVPPVQEQGMGTVRAVPSRAPGAPQIVAPRSFNDAQDVADRFRGGSAVLLNLRETDADLGRRLIDFCSGLCYGLRGQMQRVGDRVFLVVPADVTLTAEDHRLMRDTGLVS